MIDCGLMRNIWMQKEKAPFIRSVILCFNPKFYPSVLRQSGWRSFLYLGLVCLAVYGFQGYRMGSIRFDLYERGASDFYQRVLPDFDFQNGQADYPPDKPHVYEEKSKGKVFAVVVDTSGHAKGLDEKYQGGLLITKTEIVTKDLKGNERRQAVPKTTGKTAAKSFFIEQVHKQRPRVVLAETSNTCLLHLLGKLILVALVAGVLLLADKSKTDPYPFAYYFNVGGYAITPFVLSALVRGEGGSFLIYASYGACLMLFLLLAVLGLARCREEDARELAEEHANAGQSR